MANGLHRQLIAEKFAQGDGIAYCEYCRRRLSKKPAHHRAPDAPSVDHRIPKARGGGNTRPNLAVVCWPCNHRKGNLTDTEFLFVMNDQRALEAMTRSVAKRFTPGHVPLTKKERAARDAERLEARLVKCAALAEPGCLSCGGSGTWIDHRGRRQPCRCAVMKLRGGRVVPRQRNA